MDTEPARGFRDFFRSTPGKIAFLLISIGALFGSFAYLGALLAIPVMLIAGLALPLYLGLRRPRFIALAALVTLLVVAPLATIVFTENLLVPPASVGSLSSPPYGSGGSVLANASVSPFSGTTTTNFTWTVQVYPKYLDSRYNGTNWSQVKLELFISTCPGANNTTESYCPAGYPFFVQYIPFGAAPTDGTLLTFHIRIGENGVWSWQMALSLPNATKPLRPTLILLAGDPNYNGVEGPIVGGFGTVYQALIEDIYLYEFVYVGIPFFFVLLLYVWYKGREARRKQAGRAAVKALSGGGAAGTAAGTGPPSGGGTPGPAPGEAACPSCGAVVYPNEPKCWKCGTTLPGPGAGAPLSTSPPPPTTPPKI